ncbi:hypothetical protein ACMDCT_04515 [Halomonadaceae bacterium KBTZ08]
MPSYYEISPTNDTLTLRDGKASASFTVRYVGKRTVEARAQVIALNGAKNDWLEVEPPATRQMASEQTQNIKVNVAVPAGTPAGEYAMRLDMVSVDNTDEEYDQGPTVSFKVEASDEPTPEPSGFPWWIVAVVAVVLALAAGGVTWYALSGGEEEGNKIATKPWIDTYPGRLNGREASLEIKAGDSEGALQLTLNELERPGTSSGNTDLKEAKEAHVITAPFGNPNETMILHRQDPNLISVLAKWKGISFGHAFNAEGFDRDSGSKFNDKRWKAYWNGTFTGWTDGRKSELKTSVDNNTVNLKLTIKHPENASTTFTGSERLTPGGDPKWMHVLENVTLRNEDKTFTINELLIHTWGSNYVTGIAENEAGEVLGQIFIREKDVTLGVFIPPRIPVQPEVIRNFPLESD